MPDISTEHLRYLAERLIAGDTNVITAFDLQETASEVERLREENARLIASRTAKNITSSQLIELLQETLFDDSEIGVSEEYTGTGVGIALWIADPLVAKAILDATESSEDGEPNV